MYFENFQSPAGGGRPQELALGYVRLWYLENFEAAAGGGRPYNNFRVPSAGAAGGKPPGCRNGNRLRAPAASSEKKFLSTKSKNFDKKKDPPRLGPLTIGRSVQPSGRIHQSKAKSQRIAAWELLYRVQHPGRYVSRLQTILHSDIAVKIPRHEDDRRNTKHHCDGSFFRPSSESGSAAVNEDQVHGPDINRLP